MKKIKKILIFTFIAVFSAVLFFTIPQVETKARIVDDTEYLILTTDDDEIVYDSNQYFTVVHYYFEDIYTLSDFYYYMTEFVEVEKLNFFVPVKNTMYFYNESIDTFNFLSNDIREFDLIIETIEFDGFSYDLFNLRLYGDNKIDLGVFNLYNISGNQWLVSPNTVLLSNRWFSISDIISYTFDFDSYYDGFMDGRVSTLQDGYEAAFLAGKEEGYWEAFFANYENAFDEGYAEAYDKGYDYGYDDGYDIGYDDGINVASDNTFFGIIAQVFAGLGTFLAIELLPHITIGAILAVPLVFGIISFIIGKRGGKDD